MCTLGLSFRLAPSVLRYARPPTLYPTHTNGASSGGIGEAEEAAARFVESTFLPPSAGVCVVDDALPERLGVVGLLGGCLNVCRHISPVGFDAGALDPLR